MNVHHMKHRLELGPANVDCHLFKRQRLDVAAEAPMGQSFFQSPTHTAAVGLSNVTTYSSSEAGNDDDMAMVSVYSSDANEDQERRGVTVEPCTGIGGNQSAPSPHDVTMGFSSVEGRKEVVQPSVVGSTMVGVTLGTNWTCMGCGRCCHHHRELVLECWACLQVYRNGPAFDSDKYGNAAICEESRRKRQAARKGFAPMG